MTSKRPRVFGMVSMQRSWEYTSYALKTFAKFTDFTDQDLFVLVDDGSFGGSPDWILPRVEMIENQTPQSLAHNMNLIVQRAAERDADCYFFHNDVIFTDGWHAPMAEDRPSIVVATTNQDVQYEVGGFAWKERLILTDYTKRAPFLKEVVKLHRQQGEGFRSVISAPFVAIKIPPVVYKAVGEFCTDYSRVGGEDYDYCLRAIESGFKVEQALGSFVLHFGAKSTIDGGEKGAETGARIDANGKVFEQRWGAQLKRLVIDKDMSVLQLSPETSDCTARGDFKGLIEVLKK